MGDVLSQSEIDALLNAINVGDLDAVIQKEEPQQRIVDYDFRTANRFNKEHIRTLNIIYDTFARLFASYLSGTLRVMCSAEVLSVEELKYQEFVNSLPSPVILAVLRMPPLSGSVMLELSSDLCYAIISRLLGGATEGETANRQFTEIELVLIERIMRQFLPLFGEAWEKVVAVNTTLDRIETSPQFAQIVALNETVALITMSVKLDESEGIFTICLPHLSLEPVNQQLSTKYIYQAVEHHEFDPANELIQKRIENTLLDVSAHFGETATTVRDILNLQRGDVITLDHKTGEPLVVCVGQLPKFTGDVGVRDGRYAIKVREIIKKEGEDDE